MKTGDFSGLVDAQGRQIIIYDPATGRDVNGVWTRDPFPGNRIPGRPHQPRPPRRSCSTTRIPNCTTAGAAPWQQNLDYPEHFNKDLFWNWVGKVDHNFSQQRPRPSSAGARTSATRCATPPRSAAARRRTASCR